MTLTSEALVFKSSAAIEQVTRDIVEPETLAQIGEQCSCFHFIISAFNS